jgi:hypothetical protein
MGRGYLWKKEWITPITNIATLKKYKIKGMI